MKKKLKLFIEIVEIVLLAVGLLCAVLGIYAEGRYIINHTIDSRVEDELEADEFCYLKEITHYKVYGLLHIIYYDKNTGIMYCKIGNNDGGVFPIYNEDGTIRIYKGE